MTSAVRGRRWDTLTLGPARRRHRMHRLLRELDRLDEAGSVRGPDPWHGRERLRTVVVVTGTTALLAGILVLQHQQPLGTPPAVAATTGSYAFMAHQPGSPSVPVTYSPCDPIDIEVNEALAPPQGRPLLERALADVGAATGLSLRIVGSTDDQPGAGRIASALPGDWAPVLVAWTTPDEAPELAGNVAGVGGSVAVGHRLGGMHFVTGTVSLDAPALTALLAEPRGEGRVLAVIRHELAHLVGLAHVDDPGELMYSRSMDRTGFGSGDRAGLAVLGSGRC